MAFPLQAQIGFIRVLLRPLFQAWVDASEKLGWHSAAQAAAAAAQAAIAQQQQSLSSGRRRGSLIGRSSSSAHYTGDPGSSSSVASEHPSAMASAAAGQPMVCAATQLYVNIENYITANIAQWEAMEATGREFVIPHRTVELVYGVGGGEPSRTPGTTVSAMMAAGASPSVPLHSNAMMMALQARLGTISSSSVATQSVRASAGGVVAP